MRTVALVFSLAAMHPISAQQAITSATLSGRVEDVSGAVIAGIPVKIANKSRSQAASFAGILLGGWLADKWAHGDPRERIPTQTIGLAAAAPFRRFA